MSNLLKDIYSDSFYRSFAAYLSPIVPGFSSKKFIRDIFVPGWENLELKDRMRHTADVLHRHLPSEFDAATPLLHKLTGALSDGQRQLSSLALMFLPDYIERYGIEHFDAAVALFEKITPLTSCEFAVRPFLIRYPAAMLRLMTKWSLHPNHHVRRLASEGTRPRLPWAIALPAFKKDPSPVLPVLENLRDDPSEYVRRSVANHLNDIAKDNPALVVEISKRWKGASSATDALIKHACRTLLKQGHPEVLKLYGLNATSLHVSELTHTRKLGMGKTLNFSFTLSNTSKKPVLARIEYALYFLRQKDKYSKKVFKISEKSLPARTAVEISRAHTFRPITTRVYYPGIQRLSIIVNGKESEPVEFRLFSPVG